MHSHFAPLSAASFNDADLFYSLAPPHDRKLYAEVTLTSFTKQGRCWGGGVSSISNVAQSKNTLNSSLVLFG